MNSSDQFLGFLSKQISEEIDDRLSDRLETILSQLTAISTKVEKPEYVKPEDAGRMIGYSKYFIYKLVKKGELSAYYPGKHMVIKVSELMEYVECRKKHRIK